MATSNQASIQPRKSSSDLGAPKVTINAAFLEEVKIIHKELWQLLEETLSMCFYHQRSFKWQTRFVECLDGLRDLFAMQFALEEGYGYFDDPVFVEANTAARAADLMNDHGQLYLEISSISDWVDDLRHHGQLANQMSKVQTRFRAFYDQIQTHEKKEQELIFEAYCDDIGTGD